MARPSATDQAFLREVDEELRKDQLAAAAKRWGVIAALAIAAILLAVGGWLYWRHQKAERAGVEGEQLAAAYDQSASARPADAARAFAPLEQARSPGTRAMAMIGEAEAMLANNDARGAAAKFATVAGDTSLAQPFRDMALVRQAAVEFDTAPPQRTIDRLKPLAVPSSPWFGSAGEMTAIAYLRLNRRDLAGRMFGEIARSDTVPDSLRQRAVQMAGALGVDAAPSAGATPTP